MFEKLKTKYIGFLVKKSLKLLDKVLTILEKSLAKGEAVDNELKDLLKKLNYIVELIVDVKNELK